MTKPEEVYQKWQNSSIPMPVYVQDPLDSFLPESHRIFPIEDEGAGLIRVPLTKTPSESPDGKKMVPINFPSGVDLALFRRVVSAAYQAFLQTGKLDNHLIERLSGLPKEAVEEIVGLEAYASVMACRGVDVSESTTISPQQDAALMILCDIGSKDSWGARLKKAGITQAVFEAWMRNPTFETRWREHAERILSNHSLALVQLGQKVAEGDLAAIKFQLEASGRYSAQQQQQIDFMAAMNRVLEVLANHLIDYPEVMRAVAKELGDIQRQAATGRVIDM